MLAEKWPGQSRVNKFTRRYLGRICSRRPLLLRIQLPLSACECPFRLIEKSLLRAIRLFCRGQCFFGLFKLLHQLPDLVLRICKTTVLLWPKLRASRRTLGSSAVRPGGTFYTTANALFLYSTQPMQRRSNADAPSHSCNACFSSSLVAEYADSS